ncbi:MAG: hypothetical protein ACRDKT_10595 [Actinomycetota bacterium]
MGRAKRVLVQVLVVSVTAAGLAFPQKANAQPQCDSGEVVSLRTEHSKTFLHSDCSYRQVIGHELHYKAVSGQWENVDLTFRQEGSSYIIDRNDAIIKVTDAGIEITRATDGQGVRWLTPQRPDVSESTARFSYAGLEWKYGATTDGVKLGALVSDSLGRHSFAFGYELLGGAAELSVDSDGNLQSDSFTIPRAVAYGADGQVYVAGRWRLLPDSRVGFDFDDTSLPAEAFPYVLDPTTNFGVSTGGDDGYLQKVGSTYPPTSCSGWVPGNRTIDVYKGLNSQPLYITVNGFARWDTSSLPDNAAITGATLRLAVDDAESPNGRSLTADWYTAWPIDCGDFSESAQTSALPGTAISTITDSPNGIYAMNDFGLTGYASNVSLKGYTGLRLHISGGQPTGDNHVQFAPLEEWIDDG